MLTPDERSSIIEAALGSKFRDLWEWEEPILGPSVAPNDIGIVVDFRNRLIRFQASSRQDLHALSDEVMESIRDDEADRLLINECSWLKYLVSTEGSLQRAVPPPIAFGFGHPKYPADFAYWRQMPNFSFHEALMLSVGVEPRLITEDEVAKLAKEPKKEKLWAAYRFLLDRREIFTRVFHRTNWGFLPATALQLKAWIDQYEIEVVPEYYRRGM